MVDATISVYLLLHAIDLLTCPVCGSSADRPLLCQGPVQLHFMEVLAAVTWRLTKTNEFNA